MKAIFGLLVLIGVVGSGAAYYVKLVTSHPASSFSTVAIKRGDLLSTIGATGTVEPEEVVDVGAQVMGRILEFGADPNDPSKRIDFGSTVEEGTVLAKVDPAPAKVIDYCSVVDKDTVLARIDPTSYQAAFDQAEATLERSKADLLQLQAKYEQAEQEWKRAESLRPKKAIADTDYDLAAAGYKVAKANVAVGLATIRQNEASLRVARTNLDYTTIKSPVRGVIIDRRVNVGQTVVASLNAPSLFLIAKDLRRMQVWASVNEADIGHIRVGMPVRFTVDAHAGETFRGEVTQIRLNATMTQNVVTYTVVVTTDNSDGKLLPYLTANVQFEMDKRSDVLLVPNAALRWKPQAARIDPAASKRVSVSTESADGQDRGCLWVQADGGFVRPLEVAVGPSDGIVTEISGSGVNQDMQVIVGEEGQGDASGEDSATAADGDKTSNPFLPKLPRGRRPPGRM